MIISVRLLPPITEARCNCNRTSLRNRSSRSSATRAAVTSVPTKRESGSTKARMSALVLGGPPARTTMRRPRPRPRRRAPPGSGLAKLLARRGRPQHGGAAARRGGRERAATWPPRAMGCSARLPSFPAGSGAARLPYPVALSALAEWQARASYHRRREADWAGLDVTLRLL